MPEIRLDRTRVVTGFGELIAAGMAQHVGMCLDAEIGRDGRPLYGWQRPPCGRGFSVKNSHTSASRITLQQKQAEALDYRRQGYDFDDIAAQMKMSRTTVHRWVVAAMDRMIEEPARAVLKMEIARPQ